MIANPLRHLSFIWKRNRVTCIWFIYLVPTHWNVIVDYPFPAGKNIWPIRKCYSYSLANTQSPLKVSYPNFQLRSQKSIRLEEAPPAWFCQHLCLLLIIFNTSENARKGEETPCWQCALCQNNQSSSFSCLLKF